MDWTAISSILESYTQLKHYNRLFEKYRLPKKSNRKDMKEQVKSCVFPQGILPPAIPEHEFAEWLALHQIDGNNHSCVYYLQNGHIHKQLRELYENRGSLVTHKVWDY